MSVHVMSWVLRYSEETLGRRLVLLVLADKAEHDGSNAWPAVSTIAHEARMSERQVQRCLRDLREAGAIERTGRHRGEGQNHGTYVYRVVMGDEMSPLKGDTSSPRVSEMPPEPSLEPSLTSVANAPDVPPVVPRWKVDRKEVTELEEHRARQVLTMWNELAGQALRNRDWLAKIVMRLREYPEATLDDHHHIIHANLQRPWWSGPPNPSVIYGNGAQFERAIQTARMALDEGGTDDERLARIVADATQRRSDDDTQ